jgi:hypothetical protein
VNTLESASFNGFWSYLVLEYSQGWYGVKIWPSDLDLWPWKSIGFQIFLRTKYVPCLVKIHWKMLILECSQWCYRVKIRPCDLDLWPWKSIVFQTLLRSKYVPSLIKIHWRMLILECSQGCYVVFLPCNSLVNTLESTSFNGFWPNLVHT